MATISRTGIANASTIDASHITNIIDALDGTSVSTTVIATGSFSGSFRGVVTGSVAGTASWAITASTAQSASITTTNSGTGPYYPTFADSAGNSVIRIDSGFSYNATTNTLTTSASYALTASYALNAGGGGGSGLQSLQFTHDTWVTASAAPVYYGNYPTAPNQSINRMGVVSPYTGTLVSASISGYMENPSGTKELSLWVVRDGAGSPVSKSLANEGGDFIDSNQYFSGFTYILAPGDLNPFTASFGDTLSIKLSANGTVNGLNAYTTVTLLFDPQG